MKEDKFEKWLKDMTKAVPELVTGWPCIMCGSDPKWMIGYILREYRKFKRGVN